MNIGIVTTWFERGAAYVSKQYRTLLSEYNQVYIFARGGERYAIGDQEWDDETVYWAERKEKCPTYFEMDEFISWIKENKIECVFFNEQHWWEPILYCNKEKIKCGAYIDYYTEETISFFSHYDFVICNTKRHFRVFQWHPQAFYIPWGTDIALFQPSEKRSQDKDKVVFFHSAGFSPRRKGTDQVLEAFRILTKEYNNCKLIIHSQINLDTELLKDVKDRNIELIVDTISAPGIYHYGDIYLYPSVLDGLGLTIAEALSSGLVVISTDTPPMNEFGDEKICKRIKVKGFHSRRDGYYWPVAEIDTNDLYKKMTEVMEDYPLKRNKYLARKYACENLDWKKNSSEVNRIFNNIKLLCHNRDDFNIIKQYDDKRIYFEAKLDDYWNKIINIKDKLEKEESPFFLYPVGIQTEKILKYVAGVDKKIIGLIDDQKKVFRQYSVYTRDILKKYPNTSVILTSYWHKESILQDIKTISEFKGKIVPLFDNENDLL